MPVKGSGSASGKQRVKRRAKPRPAPSTGGHPSRGGVTVGGGTKARPVVSYRTPTPSVPVQRRRRRGARPAPAKQPGPFRATERRRVKRAKRKAPYKRAVRAARTARHARAYGRYLLGDRAPGPFTEAERYFVSDFEEQEAARRRRTQPGPFTAHERRLIEPQQREEATRRRRARAEARKDEDTKLLGFNIEAELEGRGGVARAAGEAKSFLSSDSVLGSTARKTIMRSAGVNVGDPKLEKAIVRDAVDVAAQAVPGTYALGAAAVEEVQGRPQRRKQLVKEFVENDPIALAVQGEFEKAGKQAKAHPLLTAMEVYGAGAAVSRAAGVGARVGGATVPGRTGKTLRRIGNVKRAPAVAPGTRQREIRRWSRGSGAKAAQVLVERARVRRADKLRDEARRVRDPDRRDELRRKAAEADPRVLTEHDIARSVDEREAMAEVRRRAHRAEALKDVERALPDKKHADLALLVAQNIIGPNRVALKGFKLDLDEALREGGLSKAQASATRRLRNQVVDALDDKKLDWDAIKQAASDYAALVNPRQRGLVERGILDEQAERMAKLIPVAVKEMGAKWNPRPRGPATRKPGKETPVRGKRERNVFRDRTVLAYRREAAEMRAAGNEKAAARADKKAEEQLQTPEYLETPSGVRVAEDMEAGELLPPRLELGGERLPVSRIEKYLRSTGRDPADIAYVTQAPGQGGARNYFTSWHDPKGVSTARRTGEATRKGAFEVSREVGRAGVARQQGLIDAFDEYAGFVTEQAYRGPRGRGKVEQYSFANRQLADNFIRSALADSPYEWRAVPTRPQFGRASQSRALLDRVEDPEVVGAANVRLGIEQALAGNQGSGKWVLVPAEAANRMTRHSSILGSSGLKGTRTIGRQFSGVVLTTNGLPWMVGNVAEAAVRSLIIGAGPMSLKHARKTIKELRKIDPDKAEELEARIGTGQAGAFELNHVYTTAKDFNASGPLIRQTARILGTAGRAPGPKQIGWLWNKWTHAIFGGNGYIEKQFRTAMLGRYLRDEGYSPKKLALTEGTRALQVAAEQAARGMTNTPAQVAAARFVRRAYGQYEAWGPKGRAVIALFTPFAAWSLNAVRFLGSVLPRDHPVLTGVIAASERMTEEWRRGRGLGKGMDNSAANWLQASVPFGDDKLLPAGGRYTPFGLLADPLEAVGGLVLPQFQGMLMATKGLDWKGDPLGDHERSADVPEDERVAAMAKALMGSFVPFMGLGTRIEDQGANALNPARSYTHNPRVAGAYEEIARIEERKKAITKRRPKVSADKPTPEYERLHRRYRKLRELIYRETGGEQGDKFKEPYRPGGGGGGVGVQLGGSSEEDLGVELGGSAEEDLGVELGE